MGWVNSGSSASTIGRTAVRVIRVQTVPARVGPRIQPQGPKKGSETVLG